MTHQLEKLNEVRLGDAEETLYRYVLANDAVTYKEAHKATGLSLSSVCGRFADLAEKGMMWNEKPSNGPATLHATNVQSDIKRNIFLYEAGEDMKAAKAIAKGLKRLKKRGKIPTADLSALYPIIHRINRAI